MAMERLKRLEGSRLAVAGLAVAAVLFLAVNVFANTAFRAIQLDLTEGDLFTLSDGTRRTLGAIDEPITLRLYFSQNLGEAAPHYATYYARIKELLERYADLSDGKVQLDLLDPEPFSDAEDRAVADGLQGVPLNTTGDLGYLGLAGSNSTDGQAVIPFFNLEREPFLEYDLTKLVHGLANPDRPVLGLLSSLPIAGGPPGMPGGGQPWLIVDQLREFFDVENLETDLDAVPDDVTVLMVVHPGGLGEAALYAVDQFVLGGGRALVFVDPNAETANVGRSSMPPASTDVNRLLRAWGVEMVEGKVAGDLDAARRVSTGGARGGVVGDYVVWLALGQDNVDTGDPVMANIQRLNLATAGVLEKTEDAKTDVTPLISTGPRSMAVDVDRVRIMPDVRGILRDFHPEGQPLMLAARITGEAETAFPEGPPKVAADAADEKKGDTADEPQPLTKSTKPINVIVVADADMLFDQFWVSNANLFGQGLSIPTANNADFVVNAMENLSEGDALIGLRGRGFSSRPFRLVEDIRRDAEMRYRAEEQRLQDELKNLEAQLNSIRRHDDGQGEVLLTAEDKAALERFQGEMLAVRKKLREVQHALRSDIEGLETWVKFINIAAIPLLLGVLVVVAVVVRRMRRTRPARPTAGTPPTKGATSP